MSWYRTWLGTWFGPWFGDVTSTQTQTISAPAEPFVTPGPVFTDLGVAAEVVLQIATGDASVVSPTCDVVSPPFAGRRFFTSQPITIYTIEGNSELFEGVSADVLLIDDELNYAVDGASHAEVT